MPLSRPSSRRSRRWSFSKPSPIAGAVLLLTCALATDNAHAAGEDNFARTHSRSQYVHHIQLLDANKQVIDPNDPNAKPYSPMATCGKCHDYAAIAHGYHFNARDIKAKHGRSGEPWILVDKKSGSQIPLSYRGWDNTWHPKDIGMTQLKFLVQFGRQMPGGFTKPEVPAPTAEADNKATGEASDKGDAKANENATDADKKLTTVLDAAKAEAATKAAVNAQPKSYPPDEDAKRWDVSGALDIDCMICHSNDRSYSHERWMDQIELENFAWAATAASGLATIEGRASSLPDDYDPEKAGDDGPKVKTSYNKSRFGKDNFVFFDIVKQPNNNACYQCHSTRPVGDNAGPDWTHDEDVHVKAGIACAECHRNDLQHHTVRGYDGELHPTKLSVKTLSCRGCHLDETDKHGNITARGGRLGAPNALHKGLPPIHLEKLSCTACHAGPVPTDHAQSVQTAFAHALGTRSHDWSDDMLPQIATPVLTKQANGRIYPHRMVWPAFWGIDNGAGLKPINPDIANKSLRRALRVRKDFRAESTKVKLSKDDRVSALGEARADVVEDKLTDEEKAKLAEITHTKAIEQFREKVVNGLEALAKTVKEGTVVYVSGGKVYRLKDGKDDKEGKTLDISTHDDAKPAAWPLGHDVRPARQSLGVTGCQECHSPDAKIFYSKVTGLGPAPDDKPVVHAMHELQKQDVKLMQAWEQSFQGRDAFKVVGFAAAGLIALVLLLYLLIGLNGLFKLKPRKDE